MNKISIQTIDEKGQVVGSHNFEVGDITKSVVLSFDKGNLIGVSMRSSNNFRLLRETRSDVI